MAKLKYVKLKDASSTLVALEIKENKNEYDNLWNPFIPRRSE